MGPIRLPFLILALALLATPLSAQTLSFGRPEGPPVAVLNQERLFVETEFGQRLRTALETASSALAAQNAGIEAQLLAEEQALTDRRASLAASTFQQLADEFDTRVEAIRAAQAERVRVFSQQSERAQQYFIEQVRPVLRELLVERGATAVLDARAVIFLIEGADITEAAINRINAEIGDGGNDPFIASLALITPDAPDVTQE